MLFWIIMYCLYTYLNQERKQKLSASEPNNQWSIKKNCAANYDLNYVKDRVF